MLSLFKSSIPANAGMVFNTITKLAAYDMLEIGEYVDEVLELLPTDPVNEKFETIGLESLYFINNLGSFFLVVIADLIMCMITLLVRCLLRLKRL